MEVSVQHGLSAPPGLQAAQSVLVQQVTVDQEFRELIEEEVTARGMPAGQAQAGNNAFSWNQLKNWEMTKQTLKAMGFDTTGEDRGWPFLGLSPEIGNPITKDAIEKRLRLGVLIATSGTPLGWDAASIREGRMWREKLEVATDVCRQELPEILALQKKRKYKQGGTPQWQEPGMLLLTHLKESRPQMGEQLIALHLSNVQCMPIDTMNLELQNRPETRTRILNVPESRDVYNGINKGKPNIKNTLYHLKGNTLVTWCPEGAEQVHRVMQCIKEVYTESGISVRIQFLVPYIPLPDCTTVELIQDMWTHPLLHPVHENMITDVQYLKEPSRCVFTGDFSPMHLLKAYAVISVQAVAGATLSSIISWCPPLHENGEAEDQQIIVDCKAVVSSLLLKGLAEEGEKLLPGRISFKLGPRSHGSMQGHKRVTIIGTFTNSSQLEMLLCINRLKCVSGAGDYFVGRRALYVDSGAVVLDLDNPEQLESLFPLCDEALLAGRRKAIINPKCSAADWRDLLTSNVNLNNVVARYRKSGPNKGEVFAKASRLQTHVRADRINKSLNNAPANEAVLKRLQLILEIHGIDGEAFPEIPAQVMHKLAVELGSQLTQVPPSNDALNFGEWQIKERNGGWSGGILLQCSSLEDIAKILNVAHGRGIKVGGTWKTLEVSSETDPFLGNAIFHQGRHRPAAAS